MQDLKKYKEDILKTLTEIKEELMQGLMQGELQAESLFKRYNEFINQKITELANEFNEYRLNPHDFMDIKTEKWHYRVIEKDKKYSLVLVKQIGNEKREIPWEEMDWREKFDMVFNFPEYLRQVLLNVKEYKRKIEQLKELYKAIGTIF